MELEYHDDFEDKELPEFHPSSRHSAISRFTISVIAAILLVVIVIINTFSYYGSSQISGLVIQDKSLSCKDPAVRREWRTLNNIEKQNYLKSIQCLWEHPSALGLNHSLYEDFPWVHSRIGNFSHNTPAFIAWHRYFLSIYERALQERCGYTGHLVYWDWTLDWEDMTKAPIWDGDIGFGGDGNTSSDKSVGRGHCVTDGPFANKTFHYFGNEYREHCLSRGFIHESQLKTIWGPKVHPEAVEKVLLEPTYEAFNIALEDGPHNALPRAMRGDWLRVTVPNDPVFFLHHTQLDRVWWMWQKRDPQQRFLQYSHDGNTLDDVFRLEGFAPDRKVSEVLSTETEILCYRY